ncbi:MAG: class I SAM-dependent methyltransferase [Bacilli bacterium]|jgi:SAM-dependent methyltransferase|nr:class I SAM-dependent methyltransferase [Bacilli bacterium]
MADSIEQFFDRQAPDWDRESVETPQLLRGLLARLPLQRGAKVLDVACGTGVMTPFLYERSQRPVKGIDISGKMIEIAKQKYKDNPNLIFEKEDFLSGTEKDYDFVLVFNAYPHFMNPQKFKAAMLSSLKQGGRFAILHDSSRKGLEICHQHCQAISRNLKAPLKEADVFLPEFRILKATEDDSSYLILALKK